MVSLTEVNCKYIIDSFKAILKSNTTVVEFGLLKKAQPDCMLEPYLIDFVDENSPINISSANIKSGIVSYGCMSGKPVFIKGTDKDSLNEHFHNITDDLVKSDERIIFFCKSPELSLLSLLEKYDHHSIGFVFQQCAVGAHFAVVLREKGIPAIKLYSLNYGLPNNCICTIDARTSNLLPKERLKYE